MFELLKHHWAIIGASVIVAALLLRATWKVLSRSPRSQLRRANGDLHDKLAAAVRAEKRAARARRRCERLEKKSQSVRPAQLEEARGALVDAESLLKIASDQVMVARNRVGKVIFEQFPPKSHDRLRARYLPDKDDKRYPFKFS